MNENMKLEDLIPADRIVVMKQELADMTNESYQPLLEAIIDRFGFKKMDAKVTTEIELSLSVEDGKATVLNNAKMEIAFTPVHTFDRFEEVNRGIIQMAFAKLVEKADSE